MELENIDTVKQHLAVGLVVQTQQCFADRRLAAAGFADQPERGTAANVEGYAVHSLDVTCHLAEQAVFNGKVFFQVLHLEQRFAHTGSLPSE